MTRVKFNYADEYLAELTALAADVDRKVVRLTRRHRRNATLPITSLEVLSTFLAGGWLVELTTYCGDLWGHANAEEAAVKAKADGIIEQIEARAKELGLEVRAGVFEEAG